MRQLHFGMSIRKERLMVFRALASESGVWKDDRFGYDTILSVNQHRRGFVSWLKIRMLCLS